MADGYKVGNLEIAFEAVDKTSASFKDLAKNLRAISALINNISNADISKFANNIKSVTDSLSPFLNNINEANESLTAFVSITKQLGITNISKASKEFSNIAQSAEEAANGTKELNGTVGEGTLTLRQVADALEEVNNQLDTTASTAKKSTSGFGKLFNSIKRIALYRLIRTALKTITSSLTESIKAFAQVDDGVNNTMSQLTSALSIMKLSFGATMLPLLQAITPIILDIAVAFGNLANMVSQAMSTTGTYTKINTELIKNYREELESAGSLLDFDKIRSLNKQGGGLSDFLIPNEEVTENAQKLAKVRKILGAIKGILVGIAALSIGSKIAGFVKSLSGLSSILSVIAAHPIILVISAVAATLFYLYTTNEDFRESVDNLFSALSPLMSLLGSFLSSILKPISDNLGFLVDNFIAPLATGLLKQITFQLNLVMTALTPLMYVLEFIIKLLQSISVLKNDILSGNWGAIGSDLKGVWSNWKTNDFAKSSFNNLMSSTYDLVGMPDTTAMTNANRASSAVSYGTASVASSGISANTLKSAFYQALVEWSRTNSGSDTPIIIQLDSDKLYDGVTKVAKGRGNYWATTTAQ